MSTTEIVARVEGALTTQQVVERVRLVQEVMASVMKRDTHYGVIPGTDKPTLYKAGAETLLTTFQLSPTFTREEIRDGEHVEIIATCTLTHAPTGIVRGSGIGSCATSEKKYAWRNGERICPKCQKPAIIRGKEEWGGGWLCFKKKDGCGAKFNAQDPAIITQEVGRVPNPDLADTRNTVRKIACKRALVAAVLNVTAASDIFTQDLEDLPEFADRIVVDTVAEPVEARKREPLTDSAPEIVDTSRDWNAKLSAATTLDECAIVAAAFRAAKAQGEIDAVEAAGFAKHAQRKRAKLEREADDAAAEQALSGFAAQAAALSEEGQ
jgi:hypothetical protein